MVLELASHAHVEHGKRLSTDVLRKEEILIESQSVTLIIVREEAIVER